METLKEQVQKLIDLDNEEEILKKKSLQIKKKKEEVNDFIIQFLEKNNITNKDIIFGDKKIKYSTVKSTDGITKKLIYERLKVFLKDESLANDATQFIYSERNTSEKNVIKITDIKK
jgi:hypothetical protein